MKPSSMIDPDFDGPINTEGWLGFGLALAETMKQQIEIMKSTSDDPTNGGPIGSIDPTRIDHTEISNNKPTEI